MCTRQPHAGARWARAVVLTVLLAGSLYPAVGGHVPAALAAVVAVPLVAWEVQRVLPRAHPVLAVLPLFAVLAVPRWLLPVDTDYGQAKWRNLVTVTLLSALAACLVRDRAGLGVFAKVWAVSGVLLAVGALTGGVEQGRAVGLDDANPIWLARAIGSGLVALLWLTATRRVRWLLAAPALAVGMAGLVATGSRGPLAAALAGAAVVTLGSLRRPAAKVATISGGSALAFAAWQWWHPTPGSRMAGLADPATGFAESGRTELLRQTWPVLQEHPWGVGWGNWQWVTGVPSYFRYPHNLWLEVATEAGWVVAAVVVAAVALVLARLWRRRGNPLAVLAGALLAAEVVSVSVSGDVNARTFWAVLALGWLVSQPSEGKPLEVRRRGEHPAGRVGHDRAVRAGIPAGAAGGGDVLQAEVVARHDP